RRRGVLPERRWHHAGRAALEPHRQRRLGARVDPRGARAEPRGARGAGARGGRGLTRVPGRRRSVLALVAAMGVACGAFAEVPRPTRASNSTVLAFVDVAVVPMDTSAVLEHQNVI